MQLVGQEGRQYWVQEHWDNVRNQNTLEGRLHTVLASPDQWLDKELMGPGCQTSKEQGEFVQKLQEVVEEQWNKQTDRHTVQSDTVLQAVWSNRSELGRESVVAWDRLYQPELCWWLSQWQLLWRHWQC